MHLFLDVMQCNVRIGPWPYICPAHVNSTSYLYLWKRKLVVYIAMEMKCTEIGDGHVTYRNQVANNLQRLKEGALTHGISFIITLPSLSMLNRN